MSDVAITSIDGFNVLYSTTSEKGFYTIDVDEFNKNIADYYSTTPPEYVLVTATGGIDIDVNDDGNVDTDGGKALYGVIKGIHKLSVLLTQDQISTNLISTAVYELLSDKENITEEKINYIIAQLGVPDINGDSVIDSKDVEGYDMVKNESAVESILRVELLPTIHSGETVLEKVEDLTASFSIVGMSYITSGDQAFITLVEKNNMTIVYGINNKQGELLSSVYQSTIILNKNDYLVFKECANENCGAIQVVSFNGSDVSRYYSSTVSHPIISNLNQLNDLRSTINTDVSNLIRPEVTVTEIDIEMAEIQNKIDSIDDIINSGGL